MSLCLYYAAIESQIQSLIFRVSLIQIRNYKAHMSNPIVKTHKLTRPSFQIGAPILAV